MALLAHSRSTGIMGTGIDPFGNDLGMFRFLVFTCASIMLDYLRLACRCQNQTQSFLCWKKTHSNQVKHKSKYLKFSCNICFLSPYTNSELPWLRANCQCCHWQLLVRHPAMHCNHWNPLFWHQRRVIQVGDSGHPDFRTWLKVAKRLK